MSGSANQGVAETLTVAVRVGVVASVSLWARVAVGRTLNSNAVANPTARSRAKIKERGDRRFMLRKARQDDQLR